MVQVLSQSIELPTDSECRAILDLAIQKKASDVHFTVGMSPILRIDGKLYPQSDKPVLTPEHSEKLIKSFMTEEQQQRLVLQKEIDFSFAYQGKVRFRVNVYYQKGNIAASLRLIPKEIRTLTQLGLPPILEKFTLSSQGFVIVTGPTGHGKSTTLASLINIINQQRKAHIVTIEDPIEYVFEHDKCLVSQRELGSDTNSFARALRAVLREDPDVVLLGEMRDLETMETALTVAETGHLVFTTLHTNSAAQTIDRIIDVFPPHQQQQVRMQLANVLTGIISQRLLPRVSGSRIVACEILIASPAIRNLIREGKVHQIPNVISTSASEGMISLDKVLAELVSKGEITIDDALAWALDPKQFKMMVY
ncbi:MAG: type IV pilus twitching motility protein PilT [Candidatus Berkelbacteria bacterium]|nr:type IV pilus twitching motility protein PilT [Candidatus Berkelbacteria bacterium]